MSLESHPDRTTTGDDSSSSSDSSRTSGTEILAHKPKKREARRGYPFLGNCCRKPYRFSYFRTFRENRHVRGIFLGFLIVIFTAFIAVITWLSLVLTVVNRYPITPHNNGLQTILSAYRAPNSTHPASPSWAADFSADIKPVTCHSHNDYMHRIPLYEGLAAGCVGTEADIWEGENIKGQVELFVGHDRKSLREERTLESLYLRPLMDILEKQNEVQSVSKSEEKEFLDSSGKTPVGVFSLEPNTSVVLLLDFKSSTPATWAAVTEKLKPLKEKNYLTHWTPSAGIAQRPITIVASGDAPFDTLISNKTYRQIFYDAPITKLLEPNTPYNSNNSYYASASLGDAIGSVTFGRLTKNQKETVRAQTKRADELGMMSRYWGTPAWPISWRNNIWEVLIELGAGILNVDDLTAATRWDWRMCVVGGIAICDG